MVKFIDNVHVYIDGCSKGNPGPCAIGVVILDGKDNIIRKFGKYVGEGTNQEAEYKALYEALDFLPDICTLNVSIYSDSQLVIKQMTRKFRIHKKHLQKLHEQIRQKERIFKNIKYNKVPENNKWIKMADGIADNALNKFLKGS